MDTKYTYRRSGGPVRRPSRHKRPPWLLWIIIGLVIIILAVLLIVKLTGGTSEKNPDAGTSSSETAVSDLPDETFQNDPIPESSTPEPVQASMPQQKNPGSAPEDYGSLMVADGVGYEYYQFSEDATNSYISAVAALGSSLSGYATVYDIVVPTSMDIMLAESYLTQYQVNSSDQRKAIDSYILPSINAMNPDVRTVPVFDALRSHCDEDIYFRTDQTWTQLGAYYAYVEFCRAKGIEAVSLDQFERKDYSGFLGGFYTLTEDYSMESDTVSAYFSSADTSLTFTDQDGEVNEGWSVISDGDSYNSSWLYLIFAAGDQPYKVLENRDISDGSACVVVQESFGNFFIPFLTSHYQYVYVIDYRYYGGNVRDLVSEKSASDVIILNNVIATSTSVDSIKSVF